MDINNWVNNKGGFAFKEPTLPNSLANISARTGEKSIAESRAESRSTYRSITSKLDRRRIKRQALLDKLQYEADQKKLSKKKTDNDSQLFSGPVSGAQADIGIHYIEKKKQEKRAAKKQLLGSGKNAKITKNTVVSPDKFSIETDLKQVKKNKFKKGHQQKKHNAAIMQIQKMQQAMKDNQGKGAISSMLD